MRLNQRFQFATIAAIYIQQLHSHLAVPTPGQTQIQVTMQDGTVWLTQKEMADFKAALERVREAEDKLRYIMYEGGWLED